MCLATTLVAGQDAWDVIVATDMPKDLQMSCALWQLGKYAETNAQSAGNKAAEMQMLVRQDGKINAEIIYGEDVKANIDQEFLNSLDVEIGTTWGRRANVWLTVDELIPTAQKLTPGYVLLSAIQPNPDNQGPGLMNSQDFIDNGADGSGIRIAVIDRGFQQLTNAQNAGAAPTPAGSYNHTADLIGGVTGHTRHGTGCLETVFDHAPGATFYIHRVNTLTDLGQAVDKAIDNNVNVITHSLPWYNTGWDDGSGDACAAVSDATNDGMLFFTSAGNRNGTHWQGNLHDPNGDDWHEWVTGDHRNNFTVVAGGGVHLALQWSGDPPDPIHDDYDLYLRRNSDGSTLASSTSGWSFEEILWENTTGANLDVYVLVRQDGDHNNTFELFNHDNGCTDFEYASTGNSTTSPSNSTHGNCLSIGAVPRADYGSPPYTVGILASYSSRGPTNNGNLTPDAVAPTNTTTVAYGGDFGGTSCATPNAAGMAAAFWSEHTYLSASGVRHLILHQGKLFKDWGAAGSDYQFGHGGLYVYDWVNNARFIYRGAGNTTGLSSLPYYNMEQADLLAPTNYTVLFLGEAIPAPPLGSNLIDKAMLYISPIKISTVK